MVETTRLADRYHLEERLASGGMGTVFAATDERLGRRVAVKLLKEELAGDPRFVERFRREARAVAALSHPNIANVFDYGEDDDRHFIVMELVEGRDLARLLREEGRLDPVHAARIAAQTSDALGHAHAAGVVHRDIKPGNIIVDRQDRVKVTDFGIARAVGDSTLTATGSVLGSAHYISPEQASGAPIGPPSDIYSLGIVLYEMLTGSLPFTGDSAIAVAMRHATDEVPRPGSLNPDVPDGLDETTAIATAKRPADRFPDGDAMAAALRGEGTGVTPAPTAVMSGAGATKEMTGGRPLPVPPGYDVYDLGRKVLITLAALAVIAGVLLFVRVVNNDEAEPRRGAAPAEQPPETTPTEEAAATVTIPPVEGLSKDAAKAELENATLKVKEEKEESDAPKDSALRTEPPAGTTVEEGSEVILVLSEGPGDEEEDKVDDGEEEDDDDPGPPDEKGRPDHAGKGRP